MPKPTDDDVQQGPPSTNPNGHRFNYDRSIEGYGICRCGARENSTVSTFLCPGDWIEYVKGES